MSWSPLTVRLLPVLGLILGLLAVVAPTHAANGPLRILLTGDSITQGFHGDYTWRYRFAKELTRQGVQADLVGSSSGPFVQAGWSSSQYADPNFDRDHFALGGSTLRRQATLIGAEVAKQRPDVIVLGCGVNDLRGGATVAETDDRLRDWITAARRAKPDVRIIISPVLDAIDRSRPWLSERIRAYNGVARATLTELTTVESPITMAGTARGWSVMTHTAENLHPNPTGETLIAQRIAETFHQLGYLPMAPNIYRRTSWNRSPRVRVAVRNKRAVLSWDSQAVRGARVWIRRAGYAAQFSTRLHHGGTMTTPILVARGTYDFRVALTRGRMQTPLGPATRIVVRPSARPAPVARLTLDAAGVHWTRSTLASHYIVKFRRAVTKRWVTRRTSGLQLRADRMVKARVWAVNTAGRSTVRAGTR